MADYNVSLIAQLKKLMDEGEVTGLDKIDMRKLQKIYALVDKETLKKDTTKLTSKSSPEAIFKAIKRGYHVLTKYNPEETKSFQKRKQSLILNAPEKSKVHAPRKMKSLMKQYVGSSNMSESSLSSKKRFAKIDHTNSLNLSNLIRQTEHYNSKKPQNLEYLGKQCTGYQQGSMPTKLKFVPSKSYASIR